MNTPPHITPQLMRNSCQRTLLLLAALYGCAQAQTAPNAGGLLQQIERERQTLPTPPKPPSAELTQPEPTPKSTDAAQVTVKRFQFTGNTLITSAELEGVLVSYLNRPVTLTELHAAADAIVNHYLAKGYLVRTILPKQDITVGDVTIEVIESTFSGSRVESRSKRISSTLLEKIIESHLKTGDPMSVKNLERGLMIADDLPGANVTGRLIAGDKDNTTGVVVSVTDEPLVYGQGAIDNLGSFATGTTRYSVNALFNGALGHGDQGSVYALHTEGMDFARFGFSLPVAYHGLRAGLNASTLKYDIVNGTPGQGTSSTVGLEVSYPLIRSRPKTLNLAVNIDRKLFDNVGPTGETTTHYNSWVVNSGLNWSTTDPGGSSTGSLTFSKGSINLDDSPNQASDAATANAQGAFSKLRYNLTRTQNITDKFSLFGSLSGQFTNKNLDSSEKFYVGGPTGVRAYPNNEGSGSEGHLLSLEARQSLPYNLSVAGFYDRGQVTVNKDNHYTGAADPNQMAYAGYGLSLNWDGPNNLMLKAIWARRTSDNPYPVLATGDDQDGTKKVNRFWISASMPF